MLYVVIAALNGRQHTEELIGALAASSVPLRVVLIDNGSTDGTAESVTQRSHGAVIVIRNEWNVGVSASWNLGIRVAMANNAESVLVAGNDTCPMPGTVERLDGVLREGVLFVTGTQVPYDRPDQQVSACPPEQTLLAAPDFSFFMFRPVVTEILGAWDAGWSFSQENPQQERILKPWEWGLFDSRFFPAYFEDGDFHLRCKRAGVPCLRDPGAFFRHDCSLTIRNNPEIAAQNRETFVRNAEYFRAKWGGLPQELDIQQARPLNVTDEQWTALNGGRAVVELDRAEALAAARKVYGTYGLEVAAA